MEEAREAVLDQRKQYAWASIGIGLPGMCFLVVGVLLGGEQASENRAAMVFPIMGGLTLLAGLAFGAMYKGRNPGYALFGLCGGLPGLIYLLMLEDLHCVKLTRLNALLEAKRNVRESQSNQQETQHD